MKILLIEDDLDICEFLKTCLKAQSWVVDVAHNGTSGSYLARTNTYDVIVLDYSLPGKNGSVVCEEIRTAGKTIPIIVLSVMSDVYHKIALLEKGADDYMTKPFLFEELKARIKAIGRRPHTLAPSKLFVGDIILDTSTQSMSRGGRIIYLTRKELNLLEYLMKNKGVVLSRGVILEHVWSAESDPFSNTVEAHILNLRKKLNGDGQPDLIRNIPGRGYIMEDRIRLD